MYVHSCREARRYAGLTLGGPVSRGAPGGRPAALGSGTAAGSRWEGPARQLHRSVGAAVDGEDGADHAVGEPGGADPEREVEPAAMVLQGDDVGELDELRMAEVLAEPVEQRVGEVLDFGGGALVVHGPGHTPGSIALHLPRARVLFTGDTVAESGGTVLLGPFNDDREQALASFRRLTAYDVDLALVGHGAPLDRAALAAAVPGPFAGTT